VCVLVAKVVLSGVGEVVDNLGVVRAVVVATATTPMRQQNKPCYNHALSVNLPVEGALVALGGAEGPRVVEAVRLVSIRVQVFSLTPGAGDKKGGRPRVAAETYKLTCCS